MKTETAVTTESIQMDSETLYQQADRNLEKVIKRVLGYNPEADVDLIRRAYLAARQYHHGQTRNSGEPYIEHPVATALILADVQMDVPCIVGGLLHDVVEDSEVTLEEISEQFGPEVASLVDGVTKLKQAEFERRSEEPESDTKKQRNEIRKNAENLRKIFLAVARDLRVMMIKLADRLHNMRTLQGLPEARQQRIAMETQQIYSPLAHRLGVWSIKWQLEDLSFKYLEPEQYDKMVEMLDRTRSERERDIRQAIETIESKLSQAGIKGEITGRPKHLWSIYQKMLKEKIDFNDIYDLTAVRIIVNTIPECYHALGIVHDIWIPIPGRFDDYIAKAKPNMYQSLHTKVIGPRGEPLEIQIRTWDMHRTAEFGIAAHWQYKEGTEGSKNGFDRKLQWLRQQLFDWQADSKDANEFLRSVINDLFTDQVFVFTPNGDVIDLPAGSTPVDFAFRIHTDLGNHCVAAKVNGRIVPLSHKLANGAIIEIVTRSNSAPSLDWLNFVKTSHARSKIKTYFRRLHFSESVNRGREILEKELERQGLDKSLLKGDGVARVAAAMNRQNEEDLFAAVGFGHVGAQAVVHKLAPPEQPQETLAPTGRVSSDGKVQIAGAEELMVNRAKCCLPIPGDAVIGFITRGKGILIHRDSCPNVLDFQKNQPERLFEIDWKGNPGEKYQTDLRIESLDRLGLLTDISAVFSEIKINILQASIKSLPDKMASFDLKIEVENHNQLNQVMLNLTKLSDILKIHRVGGKRTGKAK